MYTVLIVDDQPEILSASGSALACAGYRVIIAEGGVAGLRHASRELPDVIVTDCNMPDMNGVELCRRLKTYPALFCIPVILLSAIPPPRHRSRLWNLFLQKPAKPEAIVSALDVLLPSRPSRDTLKPGAFDRAMSRWQPLPSLTCV